MVTKAYLALLFFCIYQVNTNGSLTDRILLSCSIRQGCPLSPLLFAVAANGLGWLVSQKVQEGQIFGVNINHDK